MFNLKSLLTGRFSVGFNKLNPIRHASYLSNLEPNSGAVVGYKRLGRGPASGKGKTAGRGQKGQKARGKVPRWFEGGQTPFYKRFPIIGFKRPHRKEYHELNLERIQAFWDGGRIPLKEGEVLTIKVMRDCGLITGSLKDGVKILGNGKEEFTVPLNFEASKASIAAIKMIEKLDKKFTSVYHTKLGLLTHVNPDYFYLKKGYVPLQARPTHRRDIEYYSNPEKKGYLLKDRSLLLDHRGKQESSASKQRSNYLQRQASNASTNHYTEFQETKVIKLEDLK